MLAFLTAFAVSFVYIYLKAWQQINVIQKRYKAVPLVSFAMALCEVTTIGLVVHTSFWLFIPIGLGGTIGTMMSNFCGPLNMYGLTLIYGDLAGKSSNNTTGRTTCHILLCYAPFRNQPKESKHDVPHITRNA